MARIQELLQLNETRAHHGKEIRVAGWKLIDSSFVTKGSDPTEYTKWELLKNGKSIKIEVVKSFCGDWKIDGENCSSKSAADDALAARYAPSTRQIQAAINSVYESQISEAQAFDDMEVLKFDPDRTDARDIANGIMPLVVKISYVNFLHEKAKYEKMFDDEDDPKFEFTAKQLVDEVNSVITHIRDALDEMNTRDILELIERINFSQPLDK